MSTPCVNCNHTEHNGFHVCPVDGCMCLFSLHVSPPLERVSREEVSYLPPIQESKDLCRACGVRDATGPISTGDSTRVCDSCRPNCACLLCNNSGMISTVDEGGINGMPCPCKITEELPPIQDIRFTAPEDENIDPIESPLPDCMLCADSGLMTSLDSNLKAIVLPCVCKVTEELPPTIRYCTCETPGPTVPGPDSFGYCKTCGNAAK